MGNTTLQLLRFLSSTAFPISLLGWFLARRNLEIVANTMPENLISDACRGSSVTRKTRVTILASVIREH